MSKISILCQGWTLGGKWDLKYKLYFAINLKQGIRRQSTKTSLVNTKPEVFGRKWLLTRSPCKRSPLTGNTSILHLTTPLTGNPMRWATGVAKTTCQNRVPFTKREGEGAEAALLWICEHNRYKWQSGSCLLPQGQRRLSQRINYSQSKWNLNSNNPVCVEKWGKKQASDEWCHSVPGAGGSEDLDNPFLPWKKSSWRWSCLLWLHLWELFSSCHESHSRSHQLLFLRDVMAMYRVAQNEILPRNLLSPLQPCNVLQKMVLALYNHTSI